VVWTVRSSETRRERITSPAAIASRTNATLRTTIEVTCEKPLANGTTLTTTHGTRARLIHSERRRSPLSARSYMAIIGMTTTVLAGCSCHRTRTTPPTISGISTGKLTWRRTASGAAATNAHSTLTALSGLPCEESTASMISTIGSTSTGSQSWTTGERHRRGAARRVAMACRIIGTASLRSTRLLGQAVHRRLTGAARLGGRDAIVEAAQARRSPPVPATQERHQGGHEQRADDERVEQDAHGHRHSDLLDEGDRAGAEGSDGHGEQDGGGGDHAAGGAQPGGHGLALVARGNGPRPPSLPRLLDPPQQEHAVVGGQREH